MIQLLMIADDFTGALDTGVQFAAQGANTRVITKTDADWTTLDPSVNVLVIDAETRHMSANDAYNTVYALVKQAVLMGIPYIYKKTDSALRGNIGAELSAVLAASNRRALPFLPAFPQINRTTKDGVHYINGTPVSESVFGRDPFEPVQYSCVKDIIASQSGIAVSSLKSAVDEELISIPSGIAVFDASTEEDIIATGNALNKMDALHIMAGCAGFGTVLNSILHISDVKAAPLPKLDDRLLVLCGSVNPITLMQLKYADENGFTHIRLLPEQKLTDDWFTTPEGLALLDTWREELKKNDAVIIDANDENGNLDTAEYADIHNLSTEDLRVKISYALGSVMGALFDCPDLGTLLVTGGDTLLQCMNRVGVYEMEPLGEMASGVVLSRFSLNGKTRFVISKSGGFGKPELLTDILRQIKA